MHDSWYLAFGGHYIHSLYQVSVGNLLARACEKERERERGNPP